MLGRRLASLKFAAVGDWSDLDLDDPWLLERHYRTLTEDAFCGVPFSLMAPSVRGRLFEELARRTYEKHFGTTSFKRMY